MCYFAPLILHLWTFLIYTYRRHPPLAFLYSIVRECIFPMQPGMTRTLTFFRLQIHHNAWAVSLIKCANGCVYLSCVYKEPRCDVPRTAFHLILSEMCPSFFYLWLCSRDLLCFRQTEIWEVVTHDVFGKCLASCNWSLILLILNSIPD